MSVLSAAPQVGLKEAYSQGHRQICVVVWLAWPRSRVFAHTTSVIPVASQEIHSLFGAVLDHLDHSEQVFLVRQVRPRVQASVHEVLA